MTPAHGRVITLQPEQSKAIAFALMRSHVLIRLSEAGAKSKTPAELQERVAQINRALDELKAALKAVGDPRDLIQVLQ